MRHNGEKDDPSQDSSHDSTIRKKKTNSSEILSCGHITYSVNALKIEYFGPDSVWTRNILNLLI
jgi:hypothetical protein